MSINVKWGRERLRFSLPPPSSKLGQLRHEIAEYTQLPERSFKLVHAGAVMKDDNAPISAYGLKAGSTVALIGGGEPLAPSPSNVSSANHQKTPRTEETTITQIRSELDTVRATLCPDVDSFLVALSPAAVATQVVPSPSQAAPSLKSSSAASSAARPPTEMAQEHARLGELLLQSLLRLDAITADGEWEAARRERKGAVKEVQALLDRLDGAWRTRTKA
ncbi:hypothetical protein BC628DRAFT_1358350 [Trametes gibbosa]|nr:hypothetical protein BC628DRAFT_1358350 [Trametes gibbosa]